MPGYLKQLSCQSGWMGGEECCEAVRVVVGIQESWAQILGYW
jgi:hypothetical protein